jgi:hypothetical protein
MKGLSFFKATAMAGCLFTLTALSGCRDQQDLYVPPTDEDNSLKPITEYFDFHTSQQVYISINYGKANAQVLLQFYAEDPRVMNEDSLSYQMQGTPLYSVFTDDEGCFKGKVEVPTSLQSLYVYSPYWGAPTLFQVQLTDGRFSLSLPQAVSRNLHSATRVAESLSYSLYKDGFYSLVEWNQYGRVTDHNDLYADGPFSGAFINGIRRALWNGQDVKPNNLDNSAYTASTAITNTSILGTVVDENGQTQTVESATITLNFLFEAGWFENTLGYYYYPTDACPSSPSALKKFILIPNTSIAYNAPYGEPGKGYDEYDASLAPMQINTSITLLYEDENGQLTPHFPPGYTIGYFMISNGFNSANGDILLSGTLHQSKNGTKLPVNIYYSNNEWNSGQTKRFISATAPDGTLIYGIEDGQDKSYDDAVFTISSSPNIAIQEPERKPLNPTEFQLTFFDDVQRTYAYEDIWPTGGDYDMNDVVVQHRSQVEMDSRNNVYTVKDYFTPVQLKGSALYGNAFAVQFGDQTGNTHSFPEGSVWEESTGTLILFANANAACGQTFTVTRDFKGFLTKSQLATDVSTLNPFIIPQYVAGSESRVEVHLPKLSATSKADHSLINSADDAYYINKDGKHPFAISVPGLEYIPANEGILINEHYPYFTDWVTSGGEKNKDWWKYPVE